MKTVHAPLVAMVPQRHPADCSAAVLAMLVGVSYEDALLALGAGSAGILRTGVWCPELMAAAQKFGVTLKRKVVWDHESDEGIALMEYKKGPRHVLLLRAGLFFDTDYSVWDPPDYFKAKKAKPGILLARAE